MITHKGTDGFGNIEWNWDGTHVTTEAMTSQPKTGGVGYVVVSFNQADWAAKAFWEETTWHQKALILGSGAYVLNARTFTHKVYGFNVVSYAPPTIGEILESVGL